MLKKLLGYIVTAALLLAGGIYIYDSTGVNLATGKVDLDQRQNAIVRKEDDPSLSASERADLIRENATIQKKKNDDAAFLKCVQGGETPDVCTQRMNMLGQLNDKFNQLGAVVSVAKDVEAANGATENPSMPVPTSGAIASSAAASDATSQARPSFDCAKASTPVEKLICSDGALAAQDASLAALYKQKINAPGADVLDLKRAEREFIALRNRCDTSACISEAYISRATQLNQL